VTSIKSAVCGLAKSSRRESLTADDKDETLDETAGRPPVDMIDDWQDLTVAVVDMIDVWQHLTVAVVDTSLSSRWRATTTGMNSRSVREHVLKPRFQRLINLSTFCQLITSATHS